MLVGILAMPLVLVLVPVSDNFPSPFYQWLDLPQCRKNNTLHNNVLHSHSKKFLLANVFQLLFCQIQSWVRHI